MLKLGNILIIGDSYSAFENAIPDGYDAWYTDERKRITQVFSPQDTWWGQLLSQTDGKLVLNESFSGTTVCNTERPHLPHTSFCYRVEHLIDDGFFEKNEIETVFIFGGTNDSWIGAPLGEIVLNDFSSERKKEVFPAFAYLIKTLQKHAPKAKILPVVNCDINPLIMDGYAQIGKRLDAPCLQLVDISKYNGHPDKVGMTQIKEQLIAFLSTAP